MDSSQRVFILLLAGFSMVSAMGFVVPKPAPRKIPKGDWPDRFPQHPAGFDYNCKGRKFGQVTVPTPTKPQLPQVILEDGEMDVLTTTQAPATTTHKVTTTPVPTTTHAPTTTPTTTKITTVLTSTTAKPTTPKNTGTTFWIRTPTPPNKPNPVDPNSKGFSLGVPVFATPKIDKPFAPDAALNPLDVNGGDDFDFDIKTVGTPKAPRAPIDPDA